MIYEFHLAYKQIFPFKKVKFFFVFPTFLYTKLKNGFEWELRIYNKKKSSSIDLQKISSIFRIFFFWRFSIWIILYIGLKKKIKSLRFSKQLNVLCQLFLLLPSVESQQGRVKICFFFIVCFFFCFGILTCQVLCEAGKIIYDSFIIYYTIFWGAIIFIRLDYL